MQPTASAEIRSEFGRVYQESMVDIEVEILANLVSTDPPPDSDLPQAAPDASDAWDDSG